MELTPSSSGRVGKTTRQYKRFELISYFAFMGPVLSEVPLSSDPELITLSVLDFDRKGITRST